MYTWFISYAHNYVFAWIQNPLKTIEVIMLVELMSKNIIPEIKLTTITLYL